MNSLFVNEWDFHCLVRGLMLINALSLLLFFRRRFRRLLKFVKQHQTAAVAGEKLIILRVDLAFTFSQPAG